MAGKRFVDITGRRYGRLVVLEYVGTKRNMGRIWRCLCDCGQETLVSRGHLHDTDQNVSKSVRSCGCLATEIRKQRGHALKPSRPSGEASLRSFYGLYRRNAQIRNLDFDLSEDDFRRLTSQCCYYCGALPSKEVGRNAYNGKYVCNGIDRIDNTLGYTLDNVRPCCTFCNYLKGVLSESDFLGIAKHMSKIADNLSLDNLPLPTRARISVYTH